MIKSIDEAKRKGASIAIVKETGDIYRLNNHPELSAEHYDVVGYFLSREEVKAYLKTVPVSEQPENFERVSYVCFLVEDFHSIEDYKSNSEIALEVIDKYDEVDLMYYSTGYRTMIERSKKLLEEW